MEIRMQLEPPPCPDLQTVPLSFPNSNPADLAPRPSVAIDPCSPTPTSFQGEFQRSSPKEPRCSSLLADSISF
ncbi:hypothetical protein TIFTF001_013759 [Ficus carica]|uniref:Uncharacterized protein n=1 Tax=Ficus carica TaxID=3494 RepID=A0AA88D4Z6_FICCA|nr:hypothetical protein TIFTF001_013759 [Ficus carica]